MEDKELGDVMLPSSFGFGRCGLLANTVGVGIKWEGFSMSIFMEVDGGGKISGEQTAIFRLPETV